MFSLFFNFHTLNTFTLPRFRENPFDHKASANIKSLKSSGFLSLYNVATSVLATKSHVLQREASLTSKRNPCHTETRCWGYNRKDSVTSLV